MAAADLNIGTDKEASEQAENDAGCELSMTTAAAIKEGRRIACDSSVKGFSSMEELRSALEE